MYLVPLSLSCAVLAAAAAAQSPPCLGFNDTNTSVSTGITASPFVGLNPNSRAYQFTVPAPLTPLAATIFTGSPIRDDYMRVEIWDEDPATMRPGNRLVRGTFSSPLSTTARWQGANFDTVPPQLNPGTNYWFVWIDSGGSIIPEEPGGVTLPRVTRAASNAWSATVGSGACKFRLYCSYLDGQSVVPVGSPCAWSSGQAPTVFTNDAPFAGNAAFGVEGTNLPPGAACWIFVGIDPNFTSNPLGPLFGPGCTQHTDLAIVVGSTTGVAEIGDQPSSPRPSPFGHVRFSLPLTPLPAGVFFAVQLAGFDAGAPYAVQLALTNGLRITTL
ncbi:MAG: hypothetical protein IPM29_09685 [Planctomycetes bacterium]|nr:hypothetical protein [Planctomycetota bacterium]